MPTPAMVDCGTLPQFYRVVSEPEHVVPRSGTHMCRGCYGSGKKVERGVARTCSWCDGYGRLLGADDKVWPIPVEACEPSSTGSAGADSPHVVPER